MTYEEFLEKWYQESIDNFDEWLDRVANYAKNQNWTMVLKTIGNCVAYAADALKNTERLDQIKESKK